MAQTHRSMAYFPVLTGRDEMSKQARFVIRMALACHEAGTPYSVEWKLDAPKLPKVMPRVGSKEWLALQPRMAATVTASGNLPMPKPFPKAPKERPALQWKPNMFAEASYRLDMPSPKDGASQAGWVIEHSSGLCLVKYGTSETGELASADGEDVRDGWYVTHTGTLKGIGLILRFQTACKALLRLASLWDGWRDYTGGTLPVDAMRASLMVRIEYLDDFNDRNRLERMGGPIPLQEIAPKPELPASDKPARTRTAPKPAPSSKLAENEARIAAIKAQLATPADDTLAKLNRILAELKANRPQAPAGKLAVTYPDGRVAYIPDPARVSA